AGANHFCLLEGSRTVPAMAIHARDFEEGINRIIQISKLPNDTQVLNMFGEFRPALVPVFTGKNKLRVGQAEAASRIRSGLAEARMEMTNAFDRRRRTGNNTTRQLFSLF